MKLYLVLAALLLVGCGVWQDDEEESGWCKWESCFYKSVEDFGDAMPGLDFEFIGFDRLHEETSTWAAEWDGWGVVAGEDEISVVLTGWASPENHEPDDTLFEVEILFDYNRDAEGRPSDRSIRYFLSFVRAAFEVVAPGWSDGLSWVEGNMEGVGGVQDADTDILVFSHKPVRAVDSTDRLKVVEVRMRGPCSIDDLHHWCNLGWLSLTISASGCYGFCPTIPVRPDDN